jgi:starch synthase
MAPLRIFYLTSEIFPFCETYELATFTRKVSSIFHDNPDIDIRLTQPKYGFISERKYVLREVIRLKDMEISFNNKSNLVNLKSAFIPETRVQVYFMENLDYFKPVPELLYKARNGRIFKDNDEKFAYFARVALDTLKKLYWPPDVIICNDWQMSFIPQLLKEQYSDDDFYKNIKTAFLVHSVNDYRNFTQKSFKTLGLDAPSKSKLIDNMSQAMEYSDINILMNYESSSTLEDMQKNEKLNKIFEQTNHSVVDIAKDAMKSDWRKVAKSIETSLRDIQ